MPAEISTVENVLKHLNGFPENKLSSLLDYIEFLKQGDNPYETTAEDAKLTRADQGFEAGP